MYKRLMVWLLKKAYHRSMLRIVVLDKHNYKFYDRLQAFCTLEIATDHGPFLFQFKEDRRHRYNKTKRDRFVIRTYIVELSPPNDLIPVTFDFNSKLLLAIKLLFFKPNYEVLTQVLMDIYLDTMLLYSEKATEVP